MSKLKKDMKKEYIKPVQKERMLQSLPLMLTISQGESQEEVTAEANRRRGAWGNLWNGEDED